MKVSLLPTSRFRRHGIGRPRFLGLGDGFVFRRDRRCMARVMVGLVPKEGMDIICNVMFLNAVPMSSLLS